MKVRCKNDLVFSYIEWTGNNLEEVSDFLEDYCLEESDNLYLINTSQNKRIDVGDFIVKDEFERVTYWSREAFWFWFEEA